MKTTVATRTEEARQRLIELGGRTAQDLGLGRIPGQLLVYLYFQAAECSLDEIEEALGLSKAAVSTAARQLETLGLIHQVWKRGDRRNYYRTADNMGAALQQGLLSLMRRKLDAAQTEMDQVAEVIQEGLRQAHPEPGLEFLGKRLQRARTLRDRLARVVGSRWLKILVR